MSHTSESREARHSRSGRRTARQRALSSLWSVTATSTRRNNIVLPEPEGPTTRRCGGSALSALRPKRPTKARRTDV